MKLWRARGEQVLWLVALALNACSGASRPLADPGPLERQGEVKVALEFDASTSLGVIDSYTWEFGDETADTGVRVSHTYAQPGDYSAKLTVRGPGGSDSASILVSIGAGCTAKAGIAVLTADPQPGKPVQLFSSGSAGCNGAPLVQYDWDFGDGSQDSGPSRTTVEHTFAAQGSYVVVLRVVDQGGHEGRASRTLGVGTSTVRPTVQCPAAVSTEVGRKATFSATANDPSGSTSFTYHWQFSDDGTTADGGTVQHTYASTGQYTASVTAATPDGRTSDPCVSSVKVSAPVSYTGQWLLNPTSPSLSGCSQFTVGFPAATLELTHTGSAMTATPAGNGWPAGNTLTGAEDTPPGTFRLNKVLPDESKGACGSVEPDHSLQLSFTSATTVSGTWRIIYTASCVPSCSGLCNCPAQGTFTGIKQ